MSSNLTSRTNFQTRARSPTGRGGMLKTCFGESSNLSARNSDAGAYANAKAARPSIWRPSGFAGSSPAAPASFSRWPKPGRSGRCTVNAVFAGSSPAGQPNSHTRGVSQAGRRHATLYRARAGSNPARPANFEERWPSGFRHRIVDPDYASSILVRSASPSAANSNGRAPVS